MTGLEREGHSLCSPQVLVFQGGSEKQGRASPPAASSHRPEADPGEWCLARRKQGTDCLVCMNTHDKQSSTANMGGLGSVLVFILTVRLSVGIGQSLKVCVAMLLCKTDTHSGTPELRPVLCNLGTEIAGGSVCLCEQQHPGENTIFHLCCS